jgi:hypothetical protein
MNIDNEIICISCNYKTKYKSDYNKHCKTTKHITGKRKERNDKICDEYVCQKCIYKTTNKLNYRQHILNNHTPIEDKKNGFKYFCGKCNFGINNENLYNKHCATTKHQRKTI